MPGVSFHATRQRVFYDILFDVDKFAETVQVFGTTGGIATAFVYGSPVGEGYGTLNSEGYGFPGGVAMDCHIQESRDLDTVGVVEETWVHSIILTCARDPAATNSEGKVIGGIFDPQPGIRILRDEANDPLQRPYHFVDVLEAESLYRWKIRFERRIERAEGVVL